MRYKGWEIVQSDYTPEYYEATDTNDCDAPIIYDKSINGIKELIDERGNTSY